MIEEYLTEDLTWEQKQAGANADGSPTYASAITIKCRVTDRQDYRQGDSAEDVIFKREFWVEASSGVTIGDRITYDGQSHIVLSWRLGTDLGGAQQFRKLGTEVREQ